MNGIWVRSQDKRRLDCWEHFSTYPIWRGENNVFYREKIAGRDDLREVWPVFAEAGDNDYCLGDYPTEARALEVLDEIEQFRTGTVRARVKRWNDAKEVVDKFEEFHYDPERDTYHMPKE